MPLPDLNIPSKIIYKHDDGTEEVYIRQEELGRGGFSIVYRVKTQETNKIYAMKIIPKKSAISKNKMALTELKNEIKIQKSIKHPNIVRLEASFSDDEFYYIVLEYCPGMSIRRYLQKSSKGYLSEAETRKILRDVVRGLTYLHSSNVIHHDIKLENFIIGIKGRVKIADFGLAIILENDDEKHFSVAGTTNYLSPEIIKRKGHSYETDIWATGVAAFTMLTGKAPFSARNKAETYERILDCDYQFPSKIKLSKEAKDFITSILQIDPKKRPTAFDLYNHPFLTRIDDEKVELYNPLKLIQERIESARKLQASINVEQPILDPPLEKNEQPIILHTSEKVEPVSSSQKVESSRSLKSSQKSDLVKSSQTLSSQENQRPKSSQSSTKNEPKSHQKGDKLASSPKVKQRPKSQTKSSKKGEQEKVAKSHHIDHSKKEKSSQKDNKNIESLKAKKHSQKEEKNPHSSSKDDNKQSQAPKKVEMQKTIKSTDKNEQAETVHNTETAKTSHKEEPIKTAQKEEPAKTSQKEEPIKTAQKEEPIKTAQKEEKVKTPHKEEQNKTTQKVKSTKTLKKEESDKAPQKDDTKSSQASQKDEIQQSAKSAAENKPAEAVRTVETAKVSQKDKHAKTSQKDEIQQSAKSAAENEPAEAVISVETAKASQKDRHSKTSKKDDKRNKISPKERDAKETKNYPEASTKPSQDDDKAALKSSQRNERSKSTKFSDKIEKMKSSQFSRKNDPAYLFAPIDIEIKKATFSNSSQRVESHRDEALKTVKPAHKNVSKKTHHHITETANLPPQKVEFNFLPSKYQNNRGMNNGNRSLNLQMQYNSKNNYMNSKILDENEDIQYDTKYSNFYYISKISPYY